MPRTKGATTNVTARPENRGERKTNGQNGAIDTPRSCVVHRHFFRTLIAAYQHHGLAKGAVPLGVATAVAIEQCREGNAQDSVPVLEQKLHDAGIALPAKI